MKKIIIALLMTGAICTQVYADKWSYRVDEVTHPNGKVVNVTVTIKKDGEHFTYENFTFDHPMTKTEAIEYMKTVITDRVRELRDIKKLADDLKTLKGQEVEVQ